MTTWTITASLDKAGNCQFSVDGTYEGIAVPLAPDDKVVLTATPADLELIALRGPTRDAPTIDPFTETNIVATPAGKSYALASATDCGFVLFAKDKAHAGSVQLAAVIPWAVPESGKLETLDVGPGAIVDFTQAKPADYDVTVTNDRSNPFTAATTNGVAISGASSPRLLDWITADETCDLRFTPTSAISAREPGQRDPRQPMTGTINVTVTTTKKPNLP